MANQLKMADVQAIMALHRLGWSDRRIARELGVDRGTVGQYVKSAEAAGGSDESACDAGPIVSLEASGAMPEPEGASIEPVGAENVGRVSKPASAPPGFSRPGSVGDGVDRRHLSAAWPWREVIAAKLEQGLDAQRIYQDLCDPTTHAYILDREHRHLVRRQPSFEVCEQFLPHLIPDLL